MEPAPSTSNQSRQLMNSFSSHHPAVSQILSILLDSKVKSQAQGHLMGVAELVLVS